jgi:hypothetical protein
MLCRCAALFAGLRVVARVFLGLTALPCDAEIVKIVCAAIFKRDKIFERN